MEESEFEIIVQSIFEEIVNYLEQSDKDGVLDIDFQQDIVNIITKQGQYVFNKQPSVREIWLSSPVSGPHHFKLIKGKWLNKDNKAIEEVMNQDLSNLIKIKLTLKKY